MLTQRYQRRPYMTSVVSERKPRVFARVITGGLALMIIWYLGGKVMSLFINSSGRRTAAMLTTERDGQGVQISLQGGEWQRAENNLKLYPGDAVTTREGGNAVITYFDGTRVRLDSGSEVKIDQSDEYEGEVSTLAATLRSGRLWVSAPGLMTYSGSIVRKIATDTFSAEVPAETNALVSQSLVAVLRAHGLGLNVEILKPERSETLVVLGEGQQLNLDESSRQSIAQGGDPYRFRDPLSSRTLNDDFFLRSYSMLKDIATASGTAVTLDALAQREDLVITTPENNARIASKTVTVSGKVSERIQSLIINNNITSINTDRTFSAEISLAADTTIIHIEAQDEQGVALAKIDRTVKTELNPYRETVRMQSPTGSGQTLVTSQQEIDISGEAPPNAAGIMVNDYKLQLFKPGSKTWSYLASRQLNNLVDGRNIFTVYALDKDGRKGPGVSIYVVYDPAATVPVTSGGTASSSLPSMKQNPPLTPGVLSVTNPVTGTAAEVTTEEVVIEGKTSADTNFISVNGYTLALYQPGKTTWNYIASTSLATMKSGKNVYRVVARNANGEILDVLEYTMTYTPAGE